MQVGGVDDPGDEGDRFLRVPAPEAAPGGFGPDGAEDDAGAEQREGDDGGAVGEAIQGAGIGEAAGEHSEQVARLLTLLLMHAQQEQHARDTGQHEDAAADTDDGDVDRQPVGLQRGHHGRGVGVEDLPGQEHQDQDRDQQEDPHRAVAALVDEYQAGDGRGGRRHGDELVHVAEREAVSREAAQHDRGHVQTDGHEHDRESHVAELFGQ